MQYVFVNPSRLLEDRGTWGDEVNIAEQVRRSTILIKALISWSQGKLHARFRSSHAVICTTCVRFLQGLGHWGTKMSAENHQSYMSTGERFSWERKWGRSSLSVKSQYQCNQCTIALHLKTERVPPSVRHYCGREHPQGGSTLYKHARGQVW